MYSLLVIPGVISFALSKCGCVLWVGWPWVAGLSDFGKDGVRTACEYCLIGNFDEDIDDSDILETILLRYSSVAAVFADIPSGANAASGRTSCSVVENLENA